MSEQDLRGSQENPSAGFEEREDQRNKVDARLDQQRQPGAGFDAHLAQPTGNAVAVFVELAKGH